MPQTEAVAGYVIDVGCIEKSPREELLERARTHTRDCALMGHCIETGYGIVTANDRLTVLDSAAIRSFTAAGWGSGSSSESRIAPGERYDSRRTIPRGAW